MKHCFSYGSWPVLPQAAGKVARLLLIGIGLLCFSRPAPAQTGSDTIVAPPVELSQDATPEEELPAEHHFSIPEPLVLRQEPDSVTGKLKKQKAFAYANDPDYWKKEPVQEEQRSGWDYFYELFQSGVVRTIAYGILIAFFLFVIYRIIVVNKLFLFYSSKKAAQVHGEEALNIDDDNLDAKIQKAAADKDYRMAVRFMYLKALRLLSDKQWIRFHAEATNHEYVTQMSSRKLGNEFRFLTRVYDYMWYGEFKLTSDQFEIVNNNFRHFYNAVNS
jgi:hypothetical protein